MHAKNSRSTSRPSPRSVLRIFRHQCLLSPHASGYVQSSRSHHLAHYQLFSRCSLSCISTTLAIARYRVSIVDQRIHGRSASIIETAVKLCHTCLRAIVQRRSIISLRLSGSIVDLRRPLIAHIFEPVRSAVLSIQPSFAVSKTALSAAPTLGRIRAVEERNVLVADILEPTEYVSFAYA
jgi:hypothetical protein